MHVAKTAERSARIASCPGLTSNFFVVDAGVVRTAPSGILDGSMRRLCLRACERERVPVRFEPMDATSAHAWEEAFLTGASGSHVGYRYWLVAAEKMDVCCHYQYHYYFYY